MRNADAPEQWITDARARLTARKNGRPATKIGAVRALWPEIQQALQNGQTLKSLRDWLEAEGIPLRYSQFTLYVRRIRSKQTQTSREPSQSGDQPKLTSRDENQPEDRLEAEDAAARDPLANLRSRERRFRAFEYNPEFKEEELL